MKQGGTTTRVSVNPDPLYRALSAELDLSDLNIETGKEAA